jgi:nematocidal protein AidA
MEEQQIIDVLVVVDAETIIESYGKNTDPSNPTQVTAGLIYMITKQADVVSGNAGNELNFKARTLDVIRWRETTLSLSAAYDAILYGFVAAAGGDLISPPLPLLADVRTPLPNPADPTHPGAQTIKSYFWTSTVLAAGSVTYHFNFMIVDRDGVVQGYYWWDPFIQVTA